jgi:hypothetical protein
VVGVRCGVKKGKSPAAGENDNMAIIRAPPASEPLDHLSVGDLEQLLDPVTTKSGKGARGPDCPLLPPREFDGVAHLLDRGRAEHGRGIGPRNRWTTSRSAISNSCSIPSRQSPARRSRSATGRASARGPDCPLLPPREFDGVAHLLDRGRAEHGRGTTSKDSTRSSLYVPRSPITLACTRPPRSLAKLAG